MPPQHVGQVKNRWPAGRAGVENRKQRLKVPIQVARGNCLAAQFQEIVPGVPPGMNDPGGKDSRSASRHANRLFSDSGAEGSSLYGAFFPLVEMHVRRRAAC